MPRLVRAAPAALLVSETGQRVEDAVEVGRNVEAEDLDVVPDVSDHGHVRRIDDVDEAPQEPSASDTAREHDDLHAGTFSSASTDLVAGPTRSATRSRSAIVSTSSTRFSSSTCLSPNRAALPGPYSGWKSRAFSSDRAFVVPSRAAASAGACAMRAAMSSAVAHGRSAFTIATGPSTCASISATASP